MTRSRAGRADVRVLELTSVQEEVLAKNFMDWLPGESHVGDTNLLFGLGEQLEAICACGNDLRRHSWYDADMEVDFREGYSFVFWDGVL